MTHHKHVYLFVYRKMKTVMKAPSYIILFLKDKSSLDKNSNTQQNK